MLVCQERGKEVEPLIAALNRIVRDVEKSKIPSGSNCTHGSSIETEIGVLIGPEGGFTTEEIESMRSIPGFHKVSLGSNVLRAETASTVALGLVSACIDSY